MSNKNTKKKKCINYVRPYFTRNRYSFAKNHQLYIIYLLKGNSSIFLSVNVEHVWVHKDNTLGYLTDIYKKILDLDIFM